MLSVPSTPIETTFKAGSSFFSPPRVLRSPLSPKTPSSGSHSPKSAPPTPGIKITPPVLAKSRRKSSVGSYFVRSRSGKSSAEQTPGSPIPTPLSTHWEDITAEGRSPNHVRDISEPMSPLSGPARRARPRMTRLNEAANLLKPVAKASDELMLEKAKSSDDLIANQSQSGAEQVYNSTYRSADGKEYNKAALTGPNSVNFLPSEMKRVDTPPPMKKKAGGFIGQFFDTRSIPSSLNTESESAEGAAGKRRKPLLPRASLQTLGSKLSLSKLSRAKSSRRLKDEHAIPESPDEDPLRVTNFQQTPYSQRYGDARRAKMSLAQSYLEESLRDDAVDGDESHMAAFEFNVPDHLPNSPLCPLNEKHKSGGKALCPIHRRKKAPVAATYARGRSSRNAEGERRRGEARRVSPRIVFESSQRDGSSSKIWVNELQAWM
jgi:hypothetical protein